MKWACPYCEHTTTTEDDVAGVRHACAAKGGDHAEMRPSASIDDYVLYCATCRKQAVVPAADIPDGQEWLCHDCRGVLT